MANLENNGNGFEQILAYALRTPSDKYDNTIVSLEVLLAVRNHFEI